MDIKSSVHHQSIHSTAEVRSFVKSVPIRSSCKLVQTILELPRSAVLLREGFNKKTLKVMEFPSKFYPPQPPFDEKITFILSEKSYGNRVDPPPQYRKFHNF